MIGSNLRFINIHDTYGNITTINLFSTVIKKTGEEIQTVDNLGQVHTTDTRLYQVWSGDGQLWICDITKEQYDKIMSLVKPAKI